MEKYDPNIRYGVHTVSITIQQWDYVGHLTAKVRGNLRGKAILDFDFFECLTAGCIENDCCLAYDEEADCFSAILKNVNNDLLEVEGDEREFNDMIVKMEILDYADEGEG